MWIGSLLIRVTVLLCCGHQVYSQATISLSEDAELLVKPDCVQICMLRDGWMFRALGCNLGQDDACFCAEHVRPTASKYLASCLTTDLKCPNPTLYNQAASIYDRYCGYIAATVTATLTSSLDEPVSTGGVVTTFVMARPGPTVTVTTSSSSSTPVPPSFSSSESPLPPTTSSETTDSSSSSSSSTSSDSSSFSSSTSSSLSSSSSQSSSSSSSASVSTSSTSFSPSSSSSTPTPTPTPTPNPTPANDESKSKEDKKKEVLREILLGVLVPIFVLCVATAVTVYIYRAQRRNQALLAQRQRQQSAPPLLA